MRVLHFKVLIHLPVPIVAQAWATLNAYLITIFIMFGIYFITMYGHCNYNKRQLSSSPMNCAVWAQNSYTFVQYQQKHLNAWQVIFCLCSRDSGKQASCSARECKYMFNVEY